MTNDVGFCWELLVNLSFEGPLYFLHYIVATSYVHWIQLKVYKLAQKTLLVAMALVWYHESLDFKLGDEQVKALPMSFGSGPSFGVLSTTCQSGLLLCSNIHTHTSLRCWVLYRKSSFQKSMCMQWIFFVWGKK